MPLDDPQAFLPAADRNAAKTVVASGLSTAQWQELSIGLRDRAFFSARVEDVRVLSEMQRRLDDALNMRGLQGNRGQMDKARFVSEMRQLLGAEAGNSGDLKDITSYERLGLIYDFQMQDAREYARWKQGQDPDLLDEFPCQELVRVEARKEPRNWAERWVEAGGSFYGSRMIARKDDSVWIRLSRFSRPWPPFDFGSGMGLEDIDREEAESLGVINPGEQIKAQDATFNKGLEASVPEASPVVLEGFKDVFGDQVTVTSEGKIAWQGDKISNLYSQALKDPSSKWSLDLGCSSDLAIAKAKASGFALDDLRLTLDADQVRSVAQASPAKYASIDFQLLPHIWREPDAITSAGGGAMQFTKAFGTTRVAATWQKSGSKGVSLLALMRSKIPLRKGR